MVALGLEQIAEGVVGQTQVGVQGSGLSISGDGGICFAHQAVGFAEVELGVGQFGVGFQGLFKAGYGLLKAPLSAQDAAQVAECGAEAGLHLQGLAHQPFRLRQIIRLHGQHAQQMQGFRLPGLGGQNLPIDLFRLMQFAALVVLKTQVQGLLQGEGLGRSVHGRRCPLGCAKVDDPDDEAMGRVRTPHCETSAQR